MIKFILDKTLITKRVLSVYDPDYTQESLDIALKTWWINIRRGGGLGLTKVGYEAFTLADLEYHDLSINVVEVIKLSMRLDLDRYIPCPWFLSSNLKLNSKMYSTLRVYDSRVASMAILHGSLSHYLDRLKNKE